uniref:Ubiquitin carboxyl-terminal hydrolase CYLD n=1 Tax=Myripristis murdjan TaxID=586833 RepID=A0A667YKX0_9TELE
MDRSTNNMYFIITAQPKYHGYIHAGRICHIAESRYTLELSKESLTKLPVICMGSYTDTKLDVSDMDHVSAEEAGLLLALEDDSERLKWFRERETLRTALSLTTNTPVTVDEGKQKLRGIIRFIGRLSEPKYLDPLSGVFFGIELQGPDKGKGHTDGTFRSRTFFRCKKDCGIFAPFSRVRPVVPSSLTSSAHQPTLQAQTDKLSIGDRVTYFVDEKCSHGTVVDLNGNNEHQMVRISTVSNHLPYVFFFSLDIMRPIPHTLKSIQNFSVCFHSEISFHSETEKMDVDTPVVEPDANYGGLGVNSMVEVDFAAGKSYGTIRWIGYLPGRDEITAGVELEDNSGVSDGTFKGVRFFNCPPGRAIFLKLLTCHPDSRFQSESTNHREKTPKNEFSFFVCFSGFMGYILFTVIYTEEVSQVLIGRMKGIQGHCNSCYMDAALFSLFSCSSVLDSILFKSTKPQDAPIQKTLLRDIVNPLRSKGFVEGRHIMKLRQQLEKHGYSHSFTTDEKDPEEFLIVIMHHILALEPLLKLSAGGKVQESYCYQIFLDQNHNLVLPTVQQLLEHSFHSAGLKLAEVPSCLILQMPRFGKKFKMFDKIIPSLELDITDLLSEGSPQQCMMCGDLAHEECTDCFKDPIFSQTGFKLFCKKCSFQVHSNPQRQSHRPTILEIPEGFFEHGTPHVLARDKLELFAVLCIETSHYVSFIKYGPKSQDWIFFDSMADRQGERDGFNIPEVQACPEVGMYLEMSPAELANQVPRDMKGVAKRLFCDAYMYLYQSSSMCLYR